MDSSLRKKAEELLNSDVELDSVLDNVNFAQLLHELRVHQIELKLQNEELLNTQQNLRESQQKYFEYFHQAPLSYLTLDDNGVILEANLRCRELLLKGNNRELTGKPLITFISTNYHLQFVDHLQIIFTTGQPDTCELILRHQPDESPRYVQLESKVVTKNSSMVCWTTMTDITHQKNLQLALGRSENRLRNAQRTAQIANWEHNFDTGESYWSDELFHLLGYRMDEIAPSYSQFLHHIHPEDLPQLKTAIHDTRAGIRSLDLDLRYIPRNGEVQYAQLKNIQSDSFRDRKQVVRCTFQNITERKQLEQKVISLAIEKERINILSKFISDASHEFRTPLTIIQASCDLMKRESNDSQVEHITIITEQVTRIKLLLHNLLSMSQLDANPQLNQENIDINELLEFTIEEMRQDIVLKEISIIWHLSNMLEYALIDRRLLHIAVTKILHNAIRYCQPRGCIWIETEKFDHVFTIRIRDDGLGMSQETLSHAFERFYRGDFAHRTEGFGLGLPIAKRAIELQHGEIRIRSKPGGGTTVDIILPLDV